MPGDDIDTLLDGHTIAVVGLSESPYRDSNNVASYLQEHGYKVVPVNPNIASALGEKAYASLTDVPFDIDVVDVFRRREHLPAIIDEAIAKGARGVWGQLDVYDEEAEARGRAAGLVVVTDRCIMVEHRRRRRTRPS